MNVQLTPQVVLMAGALRLPERMVRETVTLPHAHKAATGTRPGFVSFRWCPGGRVVMAAGDILQSKQTGPDTLQVSEVVVRLVLELRDELPEGPLLPEASANDLELLVARSFGLRVRGHSEATPSVLYSGRWDGNPVTVMEHQEDPMPDLPIAVVGGFDEAADPKLCHNVWAPGVMRYGQWVSAGFAERVIRAARNVRGVMTMMPSTVYLTPSLIDVSVRALGMGTPEIREAAMTSEGRELIVAEDFRLVLQTKTAVGAAAASKPEILLLLGTLSPLGLDLTAALPFRQSWLRPDQDPKHPTDVLEQLTERFGVTVQVDPDESRLFVGKTVPFDLHGQAPRMDVRQPVDRRLMTCSSFHELGAGSTRRLFVGVYFALDLDRYLKELGSNGRAAEEGLAR